jgi:hypothetical protein
MITIMTYVAVPAGMSILDFMSPREQAGIFNYPGAEKEIIERVAETIINKEVTTLLVKEGDKLLDSIKVVVDILHDMGLIIKDEVVCDYDRPLSAYFIFINAFNIKNSKNFDEILKKVVDAEAYIKERSK